MMNVTRTLMVIVGVLQSIIAVSTFIVTCIVYFNVFNIQSLLDVAEGSLYFHILTLLLFGTLSLTSGLFLVGEWLESS